MKNVFCCRSISKIILLCFLQYRIGKVLFWTVFHFFFFLDLENELIEILTGIDVWTFRSVFPYLVFFYFCSFLYLVLFTRISATQIPQALSENYGFCSEPEPLANRTYFSHTSTHIPLWIRIEFQIVFLFFGLFCILHFVLCFSFLEQTLWIHLRCGNAITYFL